MNPLLRFAPLFAGLCLALSGCTTPQTKFDFGPWPSGASPQEVGQRVAARFVAGPHGNVNNPRPPAIIIYPETCTWYGALTFAQLTANKDLTAKLIARFEPLFGPEANLIPKAINVDATVFGGVPLELFIQTKDTRYLKIGQELADKQWETPADATRLSPEAREGIAAGLSWHTRFWVDDMYMITMVQTQAFRATGDAKYLDRAAREAVAYLDKLQQPNGLFFHAPDVPFFWGRGDGWFAAGMSELLRSLPAEHPNRARILAGYRQMMASLLKHQDVDGMWHQLIDHPESWAETSCTGMFTFAFITGVKNGWLDQETYSPAARKGWLALVNHLNADAAIRDVCAGTNKLNNLQYYLDRTRVVGDLHGQAPVLWCATALLR
jgi:unsaturated rhamnogalacturonyl hydrolase